jgi:hypothetical protein
MGVSWAPARERILLVVWPHGLKAVAQEQVAKHRNRQRGDAATYRIPHRGIERRGRYGSPGLIESSEKARLPGFRALFFAGRLL